MFAQTDKCFGNQTSNPSHSVSQPSLKLKLVSLHLSLVQEKHVINVKNKTILLCFGCFKPQVETIIIVMVDMVMDVLSPSISIVKLKQNHKFKD